MKNSVQVRSGKTYCATYVFMDYIYNFKTRMSMFFFPLPIAVNQFFVGVTSAFRAHGTKDSRTSARGRHVVPIAIDPFHNLIQLEVRDMIPY